MYLLFEGRLESGYSLPNVFEPQFNGDDTSLSRLLGTTMVHHSPVKRCRASLIGHGSRLLYRGIIGKKSAVDAQG